MSVMKTIICLIAVLSYSVSATTRESLRKAFQREAEFGSKLRDEDLEDLNVELSRFVQEMSMSMGSSGSTKVATISPTSSPTSLSDVINKPPEDGYYTYDDDTTSNSTVVIPTGTTDPGIVTTSEQAVEVETNTVDIDEPISSSPPTKINIPVVGVVVGIAAAVIVVAAIIVKRTIDKEKSQPSDSSEEKSDLEQ